MNRFIAYFDYLGFKEFIETNDLEYQKRIIGNNFRDMESALGQGKYKEATQGLIADISNTQINCINFSDTVVFFTNDTTKTSLIEILEVAYKFHWQAINFCFPVRGALVFGEMVYVDFKQNNGGSGIYNINSVFGKGLVKAHLRADEQHWAGTVIDESFLSEIIRKGHDIDDFLKPYAKKYNVPYKKRVEAKEEYVLNLVKGTLNDISFKNVSNNIIENFAQHNKSVADERVQEKIANTIRFLETYYVKEDELK
jgi:hypothetical protein